MSNEILSIKLYELDKKIGQLHSRIRLSESAEHESINEQISALRKECTENEAVLCDRLRYSKAGVVSRLGEAYTEIVRIIKETKETFCSSGGEKGSDDFSVEEKILFAEYSLDFAMQAANHALLASMEALDAQMRQQEQEDKKI